VKRDEYVRNVGWWLRDLPWSARRDLLTELRAHLDELPADTDLRAQLGPPEAYASDLRAAAGIERRSGPIAFLRARRPRNLILFLLALIVAGLAIGSVAWIDSYQPLGFGNGYRFPTGAKGAPGIEGESVDFRKGHPFDLAMEVMNTGRFTVRVLGVPFASYLPWKARLKMARISYTGRYIGPYRRFHPFDLKPGQSRYLIFHGVFACEAGMARGGAITLSDFPVRFSFLWRKTTAAIPLPENLGIVFPKGCPTPARYR
jgi:hypothetical protein